MTDTIMAKYLDALRKFDDWVTVSEWAQKVGEIYPELLEKANIEAANQANETTGLREIAARISSIISRGGYEDKIEIDTSEKPRKVRFIPEQARNEHVSEEIEEDVAPLRRDDIIRKANNGMGSRDQYRISEFESISKLLKTFFGLDFEVDHSKALLNKIEPGIHHPDNFQLILKAHNTKKNNDNWERFSIDEQIDYIETAIKLQDIVATRFKIEMERDILGSLLDRLRSVY